MKINKVILIGPSADGKSDLYKRLMGYSLVGSCPTIGISFTRINLSFNNDQYPVQLWDTPGIPKFRFILKSYINRADLILLLFTEQRMKEAIELFYPFYIENRKESSKLLFVENYVKKENHCILTERQSVYFWIKLKNLMKIIFK